FIAEPLFDGPRPTRVGELRELPLEMYGNTVGHSDHPSAVEDDELIAGESKIEPWPQPSRQRILEHESRPLVLQESIDLKTSKRECPAHQRGMLDAHDHAPSAAMMWSGGWIWQASGGWGRDGLERRWKASWGVTRAGPPPNCNFRSYAVPSDG